MKGTAARKKNWETKYLQRNKTKKTKTITQEKNAIDTEKEQLMAEKPCTKIYRTNNTKKIAHGHKQEPYMKITDKEPETYRDILADLEANKKIPKRNIKDLQRKVTREKGENLKKQ
ncbi:hypothetical protein O0L34_g2456 [Tuta absoluta]|nr:hypothetical protein O0L34_g2456 [Tuta absoluta]